MTADAPDDAQLAAYLDGELDELSARRLEARLAEDPELGRRLDRIHDVLLALREPDEVEPPPGLSERLTARLEQEGASAARPAAARPRATETRREGWLSSWYRQLGTAAAVLVGLALLGGGLIALVGPQGGDDAADVAEDAAESADDHSAQEERRDTDDSAESAPQAGDDAATMDADESDEGAADGDAGVEEDDGGDDEAAESAPRWTIPGELSPEEAARLADERWAEMGSDAAACRGEVEEAASGAAPVPLDVGRSASDPEAIRYEVVTASDESEAYERVVEISVLPDGCEVVDVRADG